MCLGKEMDNATMISEIEKLLPSIQKREWALLNIKLKHTAFSDFLRFLLDEKTAIEYMTSDIRDSDSGSVSRKGKVHIITNPEEEENDKFENALVNQSCYTKSNQQNEQRMQQVIDGLAQVTDVLLNGKQKGVTHDVPRNGAPLRKKMLVS